MREASLHRREARGKGGSLALALACVPMIAVGQSAVAQTGSILPDYTARPSERSVSPADQARQTMNDYAVCIVHARVAAVQKALSLANDAKVDEALANLANRECLMRGELRMPRQLLRGAVYRALYLRDFGRSPPAPSASDAAPTGESMFEQFGSCVNTADASDVREFVMSVPATKREAAALSALGPALGRCIAPGNQIRFSRAVLQGVLAEAAYRQARASTVVNK